MGKADYVALFWLFMAGSVLGFIAEGLRCELTDGHCENHSSTVWGPFCIIYCVGALAVYLISGLLRCRGLAAQFAAFSLSGAAAEFFGESLPGAALRQRIVGLQRARAESRRASGL